MSYPVVEILRNLFSRFDIYVWAGVVAVFIAAYILVRVGSLAITRLFNPREASTLTGSKRARTMAALLKSILRYTVYFIAGVTVLDLFGLKTGALLAGAGVVGLAVGFGAKNLIEDIITGFFILFEDQFAVGEYIAASGVSGIVEEVGLRVTRLKDLGGQIHFIPNGRISQVTNFSRDSLKASVDIEVAYDEDLNRAVDVLKEAGSRLAQEWVDMITAGPEVLGMVALNPSSVTIRISASARPLQHWKVERELRKRVKEALDEAGIRPPESAKAH